MKLEKKLILCVAVAAVLVFALASSTSHAYFFNNFWNYLVSSPIQVVGAEPCGAAIPDKDCRLLRSSPNDPLPDCPVGSGYTGKCNVGYPQGPWMVGTCEKRSCSDAQWIEGYCEIRNRSQSECGLAGTVNVAYRCSNSAYGPNDCEVPRSIWHERVVLPAACDRLVSIPSGVQIAPLIQGGVEYCVVGSYCEDRAYSSDPSGCTALRGTRIEEKSCSISSRSVSECDTTAVWHAAHCSDGSNKSESECKNTSSPTTTTSSGSRSAMYCIGGMCVDNWGASQKSSVKGGRLCINGEGNCVKRSQLVCSAKGGDNDDDGVCNIDDECSDLSGESQYQGCPAARPNINYFYATSDNNPSNLLALTVTDVLEPYKLTWSISHPGNVSRVVINDGERDNDSCVDCSWNDYADENWENRARQYTLRVYDRYNRMVSSSILITNSGLNIPKLDNWVLEGGGGRNMRFSMHNVIKFTISYKTRLTYDSEHLFTTSLPGQYSSNTEKQIQYLNGLGIDWRGCWEINCGAYDGMTKFALGLARAPTTYLVKIWGRYGYFVTYAAVLPRNHEISKYELWETWKAKDECNGDEKQGYSCDNKTDKTCNDRADNACSGLCITHTAVRKVTCYNNTNPP